MAMREMTDMNQMEDLVERLRRQGAEHEFLEEAADEIERLKQENERLRAALKEIADSGDFSSGSDRSDLVLSRDIARQALTGREDPPEKDVTSIG